MSDLDNLIPFLQQLVQRMRITPPANEIALLQKATFKEMRPYFDAQSSGRQDTEVYAMILKYLANPSGGTGLNEPASPPKAAPQQPAPQQAAPVTLSKPSDPKTQVRTIMPGVELHVTEKDGPRWTFEIATKGTNDLTTVTFDFSASMNISLTPEGPSKSTGPLTMTVNVPTTANTGGKELRALIATAAGTGNNVSLNYKLALRGGGGGAGGSGGNSGSSTTTTTTTRTNQSAPQPEPEEEDVVTKVADGLSIIVQSVETGYKLLAENVHATNSYVVTLDLGESVNLTFAAKGPGQLVDPTKVSFTLPAKLGKLVVVDCTVKDFAVGSCDIRYKVSARVA